MALIKIDDIIIPTPTTYDVGVQDISEATRNALGNMIIERINTKIKIELSWNWLTRADQVLVLGAVSGTSFTVEYLDPRTDTVQTKEFYCGDRSTGLYSHVDGVPVWREISFNLIEL